MPLKRPDYDDRPPAVGDYYVHRRTGELVEIMDVDPSGHCMVLNVKEPLDGEWQHVTASQIASAFWERLALHAQAQAA
jgi:hypothetical protein